MDIELLSHVKPDKPSTDRTAARAVKTHVKAINGLWRKGAGNFISCGEYLLTAKDELQPDAFKVMVETMLDFDPSVGRKLMCIAQNGLLGAHVHIEKLPPYWSTLYELSQLEEDVLQAALNDGSVHPGMQRKDAIALKPKKTLLKTPTVNNSFFKLDTAWKAASVDQRRRFLNQLGREGLCEAMSGELQADVLDYLTENGVNGVLVA